MNPLKESLSLSTSHEEFQPYVVSFIVKKGKNLPVGDISSSDPYVVLRIGNNILGQTPVIRFTLSPVWNYQVEFPLLHLSNKITLEVFDHDDIGNHDLLGQFEIDVSLLPMDTLIDEERALETAPNGTIKPRGTISYSIFVKYRHTLISVRSIQRDTVTLGAQLEALLSSEFSKYATSVTVQQALKESGLFASNSMSWTKLRDILRDVNKLTACDIDPSLADGVEVAPPQMSSVLLRRIESDTLLTRAVRINLYKNTCEEVPPQFRHSFVLETKHHVYTLVAPNVFMMWSWVRTIRRNFMAHNMMRENSEGASSVVGVGSLYRSFHMPHVEGAEEEGSLTGILSVQLKGQLYKCRCSLHGLVLDCKDLNDDTAALVSLNLQGLQSIVLSQEYEQNKTYELSASLESGRVSVTATVDAARRQRSSGVITTSPNTPAPSTDSGWYPGKAIVKGTMLTGSLVKNVVKGTVKGTTKVVLGTADLATSAAGGIVTAAAVGLGVPQDEVVTVAVLQAPYKRAVISETVTGIAPYWDKQCIIKMDRFMVGEAVDNTPDGQLRPAGVLAHIVGISNGSETVIGSKFLRYEDIIPDNPLNRVRDDGLEECGGLSSEISEVSFSVDEDVEFIVEIHAGENLLPPPSSDSLDTLILHPLNTFVNLSSVAVASVGLTTRNSLSQDRSPRIFCSMAKHNGTSVFKKKKYKTKARSNTLNPTWNQAFVLTAEDGLHYADLVKLAVKDDSRSGIDSNMGAVYIPKELFLSKQVVSGQELRMRFPIVATHDMSVAASSFHQGLGHLDVSLQMRISKISARSSHQGNKPSDEGACPNKMNISTQLHPSNEFTTSWMCDCLTKSSMENPQAGSVERFHITPSSEGLVLDMTDDDYSPFNAAGGSSKQQQMLLHQFLTKELETIPAGWDGTPPKVIEKYIYHVYQNERRNITFDWSGQYLLPHERREFTDESGAIECPFSPLDLGLDPPEGFTWREDCAHKWLIDTEYTKTDAEGWCYGTDFGYIMNNYRKGEWITSQGLKATRRRRWKRIAIRVVEEFSTDPSSQPAGGVEDLQSGYKATDMSTPGANLSLDRDTLSEDIVVEVFENQRRDVAWNWGKHSGQLLGLERGPYSDEAGTIEYHYKNLDAAPAPAGYTWIPDDDWCIDMDYTNTDEAGWSYAVDWRSMMSNLRKGHSSTSGTLYTVRRRKWRRRAVKIRETIGDYARSKNNGAIEESAQAGDNDTFVARRNVSKMTRREAFNLHRNDIILLCRERPDLKSPITIPWQQVARIDIVTPSVVIIGVIVNRYFGVDGNGDEQYRRVDVELCVLDCPAERLCLLLRERIRLREFRENVKILVSSGTMTGEIGVCDYSSYYDKGDEDSSSDMLLSQQDLSLGSATILNLDDEICQIEAQISSIEKIAKAKTDPVATKWSNSEVAYLKDTKNRLAVYTAALLGAGLMGPQFEEASVRDTLKRDVAEAERVYNRAIKEGDSVGAAENMVNNLLLTAEMRIRDTALCGWSHQGPLLEQCLSIIINEYYISIIGALGKFFDSKDGLMQLKGNESKLRLIRCFMEKDTHLSDIVFSSLRPYNIIVEPAPVLSLSLDIKTMVHWYTEALEGEIKIYMHNVFLTNLRVRSAEDDEYKLPWEIVQDGTVWISLIPRDSISVMNNFIALVSMAGGSASRSRAMDIFLHVLDERIRITHVECFVFLVERYREVLLSHDWTIPVPCKGVTYDADAAFDAVGSHMYWLASVANDCHLLLSKHIDACVRPSNTGSSTVEMGSENAEQMSQKMYTLTKLLGYTISSAMDSLSCIVFKSYSDIMPTRDIFQKWSHSARKDGQNFPNLVKVILQEQASYLKEVIGGTLEQPCMERFREICLRKLCVWYLNMIRDASPGISEIDAMVLVEDCRSIIEYFEQRAEGSSPSHISRVQQELKTFENVSAIMTKSFGGKDFSVAVYYLIDAATSERYRAPALKALLKALFRFRGSYSEPVTETFLPVDVPKLQREFLAEFDRIIKESGKSVAIPTSSQIEPMADMLVFTLNVNLEDYLLRSAVERSRIQRKLEMESSQVATAGKREADGVNTPRDKSKPSETQQRIGSVMSWLSHLTHHDDPQQDRIEPSAPNVALLPPPPPPAAAIGGLGLGLLSPSVIYSGKSQQNMVEITNLSVDSLFCLDAFTNTAVYVEFMLAGKKVRTEVRNNTLSPVWPEKYALTVLETNVESMVLVCTVYYKMRFRRDINVGTAKIPVSNLWDQQLEMPAQTYTLDCSGSSQEIQDSIKSESKHRQMPTITMALNLGIKKESPSF